MRIGVLAVSDEENICEYIRQYLAHVLPDAGVDISEVNHIIGDLEQDIRERFGSDRAYVPSIKSLSKRQRDEAIVKAWKMRESQAAIAEKYGVDQSTVSRVISRHLNAQRDRSGFGRAEWNL